MATPERCNEMELDIALSKQTLVNISADVAWLKKAVIYILLINAATLGHEIIPILAKLV